MKTLIFTTTIFISSCSSLIIDRETSSPEQLLAAFIEAVNSNDIERYAALGYPEDVQNFEKLYPNETKRRSESLDEIAEIKKVLPLFEKQPFKLSGHLSSSNEHTGYFRSLDGKIDLWVWQFKEEWFIKFFLEAPKDQTLNLDIH